MNHPDIIETERLLMRKFTLSDAQDAFEMNRDHEVLKYIPTEPAQSLEEVKELIQNTTLADYDKFGFGRMAVILKSTQEFMGFSGLKNEPELNGVDIGFRFKKKFWNQGFGTESALPFLKIGFESMNLNEIVAGAMPANKGSVAILKKLGMSFRDQKEFEGQLFDIYAISSQTYFGK